jgi:hypothetical protein
MSATSPINWRTQSPELLSDEDLLRRVEADKPMIRLRQFAVLAALAVAGSAVAYGFSAPAPTAAQEALAQTPALAEPESGESAQSLPDKIWDGVKFDSRDEGGVAMVRLSVEAPRDAAQTQKTQWSASAGRAEAFGAKKPMLEISAQTAQTPPRQDGKRYTDPADYAPSAIQWTTGAGAPVSIEQIGPNRWRVEPRGDSREPMAVWAYATGAAMGADGRRAATVRVAAISQSELTQARAAVGERDRRMAIASWIFLPLLVGGIMAGGVVARLGLGSSAELRKRKWNKTGMFAAIDEAKALRAAVRVKTKSGAEKDGGSAMIAPTRKPPRI